MNHKYVAWFVGLVMVGSASLAVADSLRDPTQPPGAKYELQAINKNINIQAIYYSKKNPRVIIDSKSYSLGDTLSGAVITTINPTSIALDGPAGEVEINMYPTVRKPVKNKDSKSSSKTANDSTKTAVDTTKKDDGSNKKADDSTKTVDSGTKETKQQTTTTTKQKQ